MKLNNKYESDSTIHATYNTIVYNIHSTNFIFKTHFSIFFLFSEFRKRHN